MNTFSGFEKTVDVNGLKQQPTATHEIDSQVLVDEDMKEKWDEAKDGKETTTTLIAVNEMVLHELNQAIDCAMGNLVQLVERYDRLSLVVSYSAQVRSAIKVLEDMKERTIWMSTLEKAKESLDYMKRMLELLNEAEDAKKGSAG
jgi:DNA repair ATPase RecN